MARTEGGKNKIAPGGHSWQAETREKSEASGGTVKQGNSAKKGGGPPLRVERRRPKVVGKNST